MIERKLLTIAALVLVGCVHEIDRPPRSPEPETPDARHLAWWLGLQSARTSFGIAPSLAVGCPDAASEAARGSETWWKEVIAGLAACERTGVLARYDIVMHVHLHDEPSTLLRRYVGDLCRTLQQAFDAEAVDMVVRADYLVTLDRPLTHRVTIDLALELSR